MTLMLAPGVSLPGIEPGGVVSTSSAALDTSPADAEKSEKTPELSTTHSPLGTHGLWHSKKYPKDQLPAYIQNVAKGLMKAGHDESTAIAMAVGAMKRWARGGGHVTPEVKAAAAKALAEWEALRAKHDANKSAADPDVVKVGPKGYVHGWICVRPPCGGEVPDHINAGDLAARKDGTVYHKTSGYGIGKISKRDDGKFTAEHLQDGKKASPRESRAAALNLIASRHNRYMKPGAGDESGGKPGGGDPVTSAHRQLSSDYQQLADDHQALSDAHQALVDSGKLPSDESAGAPGAPGAAQPDGGTGKGERNAPADVTGAEPGARAPSEQSPPEPGAAGEKPGENWQSREARQNRELATLEHLNDLNQQHQMYTDQQMAKMEQRIRDLESELEKAGHADSKFNAALNLGTLAASIGLGFASGGHNIASLAPLLASQLPNIGYNIATVRHHIKNYGLSDTLAQAHQKAKNALSSITAKLPRFGVKKSASSAEPAGPEWGNSSDAAVQVAGFMIPQLMKGGLDRPGAERIAMEMVRMAAEQMRDGTLQVPEGPGARKPAWER